VKKIGLFLMLLVISCGKPPEPPEPEGILETPAIREYWVESRYMKERQAVVIIVPKSKPPKEGFPAVILLSGRGEAVRSQMEGARAWTKYYGLHNVYAVLHTNHLPKTLFLSFVKDKDYEAYANLLKYCSFRDFVVVSPKTPDITGDEAELLAFDNYIRLELIPFLKKAILIDTTRLGVNGISLGGFWSMYLGTRHPEIFTSIGSLQGAFGVHSNLLEKEIKRNAEGLKKVHIRLVTSEGDYLRDRVEYMAQFLHDNDIPFTFALIAGPHDYVFNQGPGAIDILLFHNTAFFYPDRLKDMPSSSSYQ